MVEEDRVGGARDRIIVGVVEDDVGALAAQFQGQLLQVAGSRSRDDQLADLGGTGEGHLVDIIVRGQGRAGGLAEAGPAFPACGCAGAPPAAREMADFAGRGAADGLHRRATILWYRPGPEGEGVTAMAPPPADRDDGDTSASPDGRITRDVVLAAALELIERDGVDGLSMRKLARVLGRDPMILYRHAPNKAALLDGVAELVLAQLKVDPADPDWAGQLREVARGYRALALAHPNVVPLLVTRPLATPLGLRPRHPAPARGHPGPAHPRRVQRTRRPAHLPGPVRIPARPRPQRAAGTHREPGRDRRPAAAGPVPAADPRIPPAAQPGPRSGLLRRSRRTRARPRHPPHRPNRLADPFRGGAAGPRSPGR